MYYNTRKNALAGQILQVIFDGAIAGKRLEWYSISVMSPLPIVTIVFIPDTEIGGFTAHIPNIPAYGEGETEEEAVADLKVGVQAYIEENGMEATLALLNSPSNMRAVDFGELVTHG